MTKRKKFRKDTKPVKEMTVVSSSIKRNRPLCVTPEFTDYASWQRWDDETTDAAALVMHYYFTHLGNSGKRGWIIMSGKVFLTLFGDKYWEMKSRLIESKFLECEYHFPKNKRDHTFRYRICGILRDGFIVNSYRLKSQRFQEMYHERQERPETQ